MCDGMLGGQPHGAMLTKENRFQAAFNPSLRFENSHAAAQGT